ncbi:MAG: hypothetical protein Q9213_001422 [Squamulea squamosa]
MDMTSLGTHSFEQETLLAKQRQNEAKTRKREGKENKKHKKWQLRVEVRVKEQEQQLIRRRTRHLLWFSFLDNPAETDVGSLKWLTLENMHGAIRDMWTNPGFMETARQIKGIPLDCTPDRFIDLVTLVSPQFLLHLQSLRIQGSPHAYQVAEIYLRLKFTLLGSITSTALGDLKGAQAIFDEMFPARLEPETTEALQDVYLRHRDSLCEEGDMLAKGVERDRTLRVFQAFVKMYYLRLEDVRDPFGADSYIELPRARTSVPGAVNGNNDGDVNNNTDSSSANIPSLTSLNQDNAGITNSAGKGDTGMVPLLIGFLAIGLAFYALTSNFGKPRL